MKKLSSLLTIFLASTSIAAGSYDVSLSEIVIPLSKEIGIADYSKKTCSGSQCRHLERKLPEGSKIKIVSQDQLRGMYKIEAFEEDGTPLGTYYSSKKYVDQAFNWSVVEESFRLLVKDRKKGIQPEASSCQHGIRVDHHDELTKAASIKGKHRVTLSDVQNKLSGGSSGGSSSSGSNPYLTDSMNGADGGPDVPMTEYNGDQYISGCEVLASEKLSEADKESLQKCISNIRYKIAPTAGRGGLIKTPEGHQQLLKNMFARLNPKEQVFAAKVFTSIGETESLKNTADYMGVMKVLENRARLARQRSKDGVYNELDVALAHKQFSMYNYDDPVWKRIFDPNQRLSGDTTNKVLDALITMDNIDTSKFNNAYLYHANYVNPKWNYSLLTKPFAMDFGEGGKTKYGTEVYHKFYAPKRGTEGVGLGNFKKYRKSSSWSL